MIPDGNLDLLKRKNKKHQEWLIVGKYGSDSKESACNCMRYRFDPWVRKTPWRRKMATYSSILASKTPWTEDLVGYSP